MPAYDYFCPKTVDEALAFLAAHEGVKILAGGTELLPRLRKGLEEPRVLLDITGTELSFIRLQGELLRIGATALLSQLENSVELRKLYPALAKAASEIGGLQTRNLGTAGGNICTGNPSADLAPALLALEARVKVRSAARGEREIPLDAFFVAPRIIALERDEIVTEIVVRMPGGSFGSAFAKMGRRKAMRLAVVNAAAYLEVEGNTMTRVRLAMGTVAPTPLRLYASENFLTGREYAPQVLDEAVIILLQEISPRDSLRATAAYRRNVAAVLLKQVLAEAFGRALAGGN